MNNPNFVVLKSIAIFLVVAMCLKHCNKAEALPLKPDMEHSPRVEVKPEPKTEEEFFPEVSKSSNGFKWRCETWSTDQYFGWAESNDWAVAASRSLKFCKQSPGKEKCGIPVCAFNNPEIIYKT